MTPWIHTNTTWYFSCLMSKLLSFQNTIPNRYGHLAKLLIKTTKITTIEWNYHGNYQWIWGKNCYIFCYWICSVCVFVCDIDFSTNSLKKKRTQTHIKFEVRYCVPNAYSYAYWNHIQAPNNNNNNNNKTQWNDNVRCNTVERKKWCHVVWKETRVFYPPPNGSPHFIIVFVVVAACDLNWIAIFFKQNFFLLRLFFRFVCKINQQSHHICWSSRKFSRNYLKHAKWWPIFMPILNPWLNHQKSKVFWEFLPWKLAKIIVFFSLN